MDATTYTGNASITNIVNAAPFKPDLVWIKSRSNAYSHFWCDSVRGVSRYISSNNADVEVYDPGYEVTSFNSNGFGLANNSGTNGNGLTYVGWQWQAGQGTTSTNTTGTITSTVSANATAGFSVITYTGNGSNSQTIGHGLGVTPQFVIFKCRSNNESWNVYQSTIAAGYNLRLNSTSGLFNENNYNTFTSSVISVNGNDPVNHSAWTYVAYCWAPVAGFSQFGSYTGNGSTDGPFVYTGFRPKFVLFKNASGGAWVLMDTSRGLYNEMTGTNALYPNSTVAEGNDPSNRQVDFLSNGFKLRCTGGDANGSGNTIIYMAFAENPFKYANAR
jgi:hypothetical protein